jgi:RNA polymerase sigma factor (sigma-70 family)
VQHKAEHELARLHRDYHPALFAYFRRRTSDQAEAEDLTQEVFLRIAGAYPAQMQSTEAYIFQTAANLLRDRARRDRVRTSFAIGARQVEGVGVDTLDPYRTAAGRQDLTRLLQGLAELPERTQQIFLLFRYEQIDQRSIAASFGISVSAVEKHVSRAMVHLMTRMRSGE